MDKTPMLNEIDPRKKRSLKIGCKRKDFKLTVLRRINIESRISMDKSSRLNKTA